MFTIRSINSSNIISLSYLTLPQLSKFNLVGNEYPNILILPSLGLIKF